MRLMGKVRVGFFPAPAEAVKAAAKLMIAPRGKPFTLLDPCAGEGEAIGLLGRILKCDPRHIFAVELEEDRAAACMAALPQAKVLGPASFFGIQASPNSFSLAWANPPFDHQDGGGRVEAEFLRRAAELLMPSGIMALVCPASQVDSNYSEIRLHFQEWFDQVQTVPFPEEQRHFNEVIVFGVKRKQPVDRYQFDWKKIQAPAGTRYRIPAGVGPRLWKKVEPTETELARALAVSLLRLRWTAPEPAQLGRPLLPLTSGHIALLLSSGNLDGVVEPDGQPPHVVRGTSRKRDYVSSCTTTENDDGSETTRTVISQKIDLVVKTIGLDGVIRSYANADEESPTQEVEE